MCTVVHSDAERAFDAERSTMRWCMADRCNASRSRVQADQKFRNKPASGSETVKDCGCIDLSDIVSDVLEIGG